MLYTSIINKGQYPRKVYLRNISLEVISRHLPTQSLQYAIGVVLVSLLLTSNIFHTLF